MGLAALIVGSRAGRAQPATDPADSAAVAPVQWQLVVNGTPVVWPMPAALPLDSLRGVARRALHHVQQQGYYRAQIDSVAVQKWPTPVVRLYMQRGPLVRLGGVRIVGAEAIPPAALRAMMQTQEGERLRPDQLEADIAAMLARYEAAGYPLAQIRITRTTMPSDGPPSLALTLQVDEGPGLWLKRITLPPSARTRPAMVAALAGLEVGAPLVGFDPDAVRRQLRNTELFQTVGVPALHVGPKGGATLHIPVDEKPPGTFDLALGYLPPEDGRGAQVVGRGHLVLHNLFGGGRSLNLQLDRRPGQASAVAVRAADPYLFDRPIRLAGVFEGAQRDSTFGEQAYRLMLGYQPEPGSAISAVVSREVTQPGPAGARLMEGAQRIPHATSWFVGVTLRHQQLDRPINPRQGFRVETTLERGWKHRRWRVRTAAGDTARQTRTLRQERLRVTARLFVPTLRRQVLALGLDASVLRSETYTRDDLFWLGGANSLRGYDEDRFLGNAVGRVLLEYRYQVDRVSYAYLFGDLGVVVAPERAGPPADRALHPGYGVGVQFGTGLGLVNVSYALNPSDMSPADGRIHLRLSFDL